MAIERNLYGPVKSALEVLIRGKFGNCYLEITADGFSDAIKRHVPQHREIIFKFLENARPDLTGFIEGEYNITNFVVAEVKGERLKPQHIYQTRMYADLLGAKYAVLISTSQIAEELKRLCRVIPALYFPSGTLALTRFDAQSGALTDWHERNPFE